jgi:N-acetyl-gamma-glutamyl-phosphate reductase
MADRAGVAVVGASGYSGAELVSILLGHPRVSVRGLFGSAKRDAGAVQPYSSIFPRFRGRLDLPVKAASVDEIAALGVQACFLATPHEASLELAPALVERGVRVLDLSAAFRLKDASLYPAHYGFTHAHPALLAEAVYGLPEVYRAELAKARLVAVPGCYPTSAIVPLRPLIAAGAIDLRQRIIIDSTSGVSGAGRAAQQKSLFCEVSLQPYGVFGHRHQPEIDAYAGAPTIFTPHLGAYERGILSTIHAELNAGWTIERVRETLAAAYAGEPFVRLCPAGVFPAVADVRQTNFCDIGVAAKTGHLIIASAIDNLTKGAAGQAVQAMNACLGFPETLGILNVDGTEETR